MNERLHGHEESDAYIREKAVIASRIKNRVDYILSFSNDLTDPRAYFYSNFKTSKNKVLSHLVQIQSSIISYTVVRDIQWAEYGRIMFTKALRQEGGVEYGVTMSLTPQYGVYDSDNYTHVFTVQDNQPMKSSVFFEGNSPVTTEPIEERDATLREIGYTARFVEDFAFLVPSIPRLDTRNL